MARSPSVILTPTEKKVQVAQIKGQIKDNKATVSAKTKELKALAKAHAAAVKAVEKELNAAIKESLSLDTQLLKLTPPKASAAVA